MKKTLILLIIFSFVCNTSYSKRLDEMNSNSNPDITNDLIYSQDVSDTSESSFGTGKSLTIKNALKAGKITVDGTNVGINSVNPTQRLDVVGTVKATTFIGDGSGLTGVAESASDEAYGIAWDGDTTGIASKNAIYDKIETMPDTVSDAVYGSGWNGDTTGIASKNALYDKIETISSGAVDGEDSNVIFNVKTEYSASGDGIDLYDGAITSGTPNFTSASATFTADDVGKVITISNAGGTNIDLTTTILAYVSPTAVTLATNALATVSNAMFIYGTDDTDEIRAAVAAVYDSGSGPHQGTVFFPEGIYMINGLFNQTNNSQIALPTVDLDQRPVSITFKGSGKPHLNSRHMTGSTIFGARYGTNGTYSIISGKNAGQSGDMTWVRVHFQDIAIKTVQDPTHSALNLIDINMASGDNVQIMANIAPGASVPIQTHNDSFGLIMPGALNGNVSAQWTATKVIRFYNGIQFGEHGQGDDIMVAYAVNGLLFKDCRYPARIGYVSVEIVVNSVVMQGLVTNYIQIDTLDLEHASGTFAPIYNLVDTTDIGQGYIGYAIFDNGGGNTFTRNGGKNITTHNMETNVTTKRSTTGTQSVFEATLTDSASSGGGIQLQQNDGTTVGAGTRIGKIVFAGANAAAATAGQFNAGATINAIASETFSSSSNGGTDLTISTVPIGTGTLSERVRITSEGNFGIGTTTPTQALHVVGNARVTGLTSGECVQASTGGLLTTTGSACGAGGGSGTVNSGGADFVAIYDSAGTAVSASSVLSDNGTNIGVGTVGPVSKLQVNGTITATAFSGDGSALTGVGGGGWTDGGTNVFPTATTDNVGIGTTTPSTTLEIVKQSSQHPLMVSSTATGDGDYLIVRSSGNVGIGTTIPIHFLAIRAATVSSLGITNTSSSSSSAGAGIQSISDDNAPVVLGDRLAFYTFGGSADTGDTIANGGAITGYADGTWSATSAPTEVRIEVAPSGSTTRAVALVADSTSNIGIGTTTPQTKLQVVGAVTATSFSGDGSALTGISAGGWVDGGTNVYVSPTTDNVGIGTTTPSTNFKADVRGNLYVSGNVGIGTLLPRGTLDLGPTGTIYTQTITGPTGPTILGTSNNVGIGTITAGSLLTVGSTGQVTVSSAGAVATSSTVSVADDAYAAGWNGSTAVPTKNAVYDKIETLGAGYWTDAGVFTYLTTTTDNVGIGTVAPDQRLKVEGGSAANVSAMVRNSDSSGLASVKVWNSANLGFEMVATGSGYAIPSTYGVLATAGESLSFGESDGTINMRINPAGTVRFTPTDTPDTCNAGNEGSLYYDNSLNEFCDCDGSSWAQVDGGGAC